MRLPQARLPIAHKRLDVQLQVTTATLNQARQSQHFGENDPFVQALTQETEALRAAELRVAVLRAELAEAQSMRDVQQARFKKAVVAFVGHVNAVAKGDATVIVGAGLEMMRPPSPSRELLPPQVFHPAPGLLPGEVKLRWPRVHGAVAYQIERGPAPLGPFLHVGSCTTCTVKLSKQPTNVELWYQVQATGPSGVSAFSTPVPALLPEHVRAAPPAG